ncbi:MAG TPA: hypothetical protein VIJ54_06005 [Actinomycetes bacterium]
MTSTHTTAPSATTPAATPATQPSGNPNATPNVATITVQIAQSHHGAYSRSR